MPRTKPKVNPNRGHVAGEKLIHKKFEISRFSVIRTDSAS
jgi:hypothetical protein